MPARPDPTLIAYRSAARLARLVPSAADDTILPGIGRVAAVFGRQRRETVARHLRRVDATMSRRQQRVAVRAAFSSYARYWAESLRLPHLSSEVVDQQMHTDGYHPHVTDGLSSGTGVILALPHLGGWEWAGRWLVDRGHRVTVVVEAIEPPELFEWFTDLRSTLGMKVVALGPRAASDVLAALRRNEIVCLLCDRDIGGSGVEVEFFGERTTLPAGPVTLALRAGAPLLPTAVYFTDDGGHLGLVRPPLDLRRTDAGLRSDVKAGTQRLAMELERLVRRAPEQWHLFQPNWPSDLGSRDP